MPVNNIEVPYIEFKLGNSTYLNTKIPRFFMSLEHKLNGTNTANAFTVKIAFAPNANESPNTIEMALALSNKICEFSYGDLTKGLLGPFTGIITDYTMDISDGQINYTITGYSEVVRNNMMKYSFNRYQNMKPSTIIRQILTEDKYGLSDYLDIGEFATDDQEIPEVQAISDKSPMEYIISLLSLMKYEGDTDDKITSIYKTYIDDYRHEFNLVRLDPNSQSTSNVLSFDLNNPNNWGVISFSSKFKGTMVLCNTLNELGTKDPRFGIDEEGKVVEFPITGPATVGAAGSDSDKAQSQAYPDQNWWANATQYPYEAEITVRGLNTKVHLMDSVSVNIYFNGISHHTSGNYYVLGITNNISADGYIQTYKLLKISPDYNAYETINKD